ncbi:helix-turn-helix domain-containing protein [Rhodocytophaga rosea]|uniref:Helix-turn-helix domain-containing protein n=1 Tax=Rhodocytophaga rosea TaxID=2704465 RepID=A0A6C0GSR4_9BACT|nr:helix-turn-helix domain-containing protein [Rhodocytophaga rosea]QHT71185.1 helix-turn-helix domain-containing protein [Rhodocytophaga rosea]
MENVLFTQLSIPEIRLIFRQELENFYTSKKPDLSQLNSDQWFDLTELCEYLPDKPVKATVYGWVHSSVIPFHKRAKKLFFLKSEIDQWLKSGRRKTLVETANEAENYLSNCKK